jgi:hypothetical protein
MELESVKSHLEYCTSCCQFYVQRESDFNQCDDVAYIYTYVLLTDEKWELFYQVPMMLIPWIGLIYKYVESGKC